MKRALMGVVALLFVVAIAGTATAGPVVIHVYTTLAPNAYGSPSYPAWEQNAIMAMQNDGAAQGTPGVATYFYQVSNVTSAEAIVTGFPSWMGQTDPGTVFGSAFASELGNRMSFPLWIDGGGTPFSISQLSIQMQGTDPGNLLEWSWGIGTYNYGSGYVGLNYGADGVKGGGDDYFVTSGANTQLVNELYGRGSGNSFDAYCPGCTVAEQQAALDAAAAYPGVPFEFTGTYTLTLSESESYNGSATFNVASVPDGGATVALLGCALAGLGVLRRKFRS